MILTVNFVILWKLQNYYFETFWSNITQPQMVKSTFVICALFKQILKIYSTLFLAAKYLEILQKQ